MRLELADHHIAGLDKRRLSQMAQECVEACARGEYGWMHLARDLERISARYQFAHLAEDFP